MEKVRVQGDLLNVDVRGELSQFEWQRATWREDKLIAASPFRPDNTPSFFVRLEAKGEYAAGIWADSGAHGGEYEKGGFVQLLAYLRQESQEDTAQYLLEKYGTGKKRAEKLVAPRLARRQTYRRLDVAKSVHVAESRYLTRRGISADVQRAAKCGKPLLFNTPGYTALPWLNDKGEICNIKYRSTSGKKFFYERDAQPISELVYGADLYITHKGDLIVCEAEIDALTWRTVGYAAVAVGGSTLNKKQADIIKRLPCATVIVAGDNDAAGAKLTKKALQLLRGKRFKVIDYDTLTAKDANDILQQYGAAQLAKLVENACTPSIILPISSSK